MLGYDFFPTNANLATNGDIFMQTQELKYMSTHFYRQVINGMGVKTR